MSRKKKDFDPRKNWGHKTKPVKSTAAERLEFCRELWTDDPHIPINGNKGMNQRLLEKFGKAARAEQLMTVRSEVLNAKKATKAFNPVLESNPLHYNRKVVEGRAKPLPTPPPVPDPPPIRTPEFPKPLLQEHPIPVPPEPHTHKAEETQPQVPTKDTDTKQALGTTKSTKDTRIRYEFAKMYFIKHPHATNQEAYDAVAAEFGMGIGTPALADIKEELGVGHRRPSRRHQHQKPKQHTQTVEDVLKTAKSQRDVTTARNKEKGAMHTKETAKGPIKAAIQMLLDEVPNLKSLNLQLDEEGKALTADFEVYSRAYETGSIEL